jgi:putative copper export protein
VQAEPLIHWSDPVKELTGFVALFLSAGPIGFRYFALRGRRIESDRPFYDDAARRAAWLGLVGVIITLAIAAAGLPQLATRRHTTVAVLLTTDVATMLQIGFLAVAVIGYAMATSRREFGWHLAVVGIIVATLRSALLGKWSSLVNPIHSLAAALWIGTLFVLVLAGLSALLAHEPTRERRGAIAADMVNGFSPVALTMGGVVVLFGLITAWRHLHRLSNLWSTPYGDALIVKLVFVALVFALGAWNWRRQRPTLGTESAAGSIRRSAVLELAVAGIVLVVTAIIVSLPSPKA